MSNGKCVEHEGASGAELKIQGEQKLPR